MKKNWFQILSLALNVALLIALLDFLPVFGTGIALIPWGIVKLLGGEYAFAAGLLLFAVWVVFSLLLIGNEKACGEEADRFDAWMDKVMLWLTGGSDKDNNQGLGFN